MKSLYSVLFVLIGQLCFAQNSISGQLLDENEAPIEFANVILYATADSSMVKVETSNSDGKFAFKGMISGNYFLKSSFVGYQEIEVNDLDLSSSDIDLGGISFTIESTTLQEATVTARRAIVEVKPDRTVFNVEGTINAVGDDAISLLRKAPGVLVDNNDNISVLGRSGVLVYVDGKRLPLGGEDLSNYLQSLTAEQIDHIDIITNPGAKYEAEGNAGIIDIRLKKNKNHGSNGTISSSFSHGRYPTGNLNLNGNYRNDKLNVYGAIGTNAGKRFMEMNFDSRQNGLRLNEQASFISKNYSANTRFGMDYYLSKNQTLGFQISNNITDASSDDYDRIDISPLSTPDMIDSILVAETETDRDFDQNSFNINYAYSNKETFNLNIDLDYGRFRTDRFRVQPNDFFDASLENLLSSNTQKFDTPTDIDIYTAKVDFEKNAFGGNLGIGAKLSKIDSDNSFLVFDVVNETDVMDERSSNIFGYDEMVYAGYINYARRLNDRWNLNAGLRAEQTGTDGVLTAFMEELQEEAVIQDYLSWFPNIGLTYSKNPNHIWAVAYGRRINRPDYNVLNPFNNQLSEISFEKGNPNLRPEIVNNMELSYTLKYRYNFKLSYSKTTDQITRLIGPDDSDPRASFINWDNLAEQTVYNFNAALPFQFTDKWNSFFNVSASYIDNQADYGDGAIVDVQKFNYNLFQQQTFTLPKGYVFELSGWFSGPGVWGGVFEYDASYSLNLGLQKKFFDNKLNVKISANDITQQAYWSGVSEFDGLVSEGDGRWDSRRVGINLSYNFGNQNVKSRKRKTGLEDEAGRVGDGE